MAKRRPEVAAQGAVQRTFPTHRATVSVTAASGTASLTAYAGKWIWLGATTLDITLLRTSQTLTNGAGYVLKTTDPYLEMYVDPDGDMTMSHIASGAATLVILYEASE